MVYSEAHTSSCFGGNMSYQPHGGDQESTPKVYSRQQLRAELGMGVREFRKKVLSGEITKLERGHYALGELSPQQWAAALLQIHPQWVLSGTTAYQFYCKLPFTFPLQFRAPRQSKPRKTDKFWVTAHRNHMVSRQGLVRVVPPIVAAWDAHDDIAAHTLSDFLEDAYAKKDGKRRLEQHLSWMGAVPAVLRSYVSTLSIGSDSRLERRFFRGLKRRGLEFEQNVMLGPYLWDFRSKRFKRLLIEIGAYTYHRDLSTAEGQAAYVREAWKFNYAVLEGHIVLQFTAKCIDEEMERCLDMVEDVIAVLEGTSPRRVWGPPWRWHSWLVRHNALRRIA